MNFAEASKSRSELIGRSLTRHRLVFVQIGSVFEPLRAEMISELGGVAASIDERHDWDHIADQSKLLVITDLEKCATADANLLGEVRALALALLDAGKMVCLVSKVPRLSYLYMPGSSVLEDAALVTLPLLSDEEAIVPPNEHVATGGKWPSVAAGTASEEDSVALALEDLGQGLVAALDHALFELDPKGVDGLKYLSPRELEGLRGSGLVEIGVGGSPSLPRPGSQKMLRDAMSAHVSQSFAPAATLPTVSSGLWQIERRIRGELRKAAIAEFKSGWKEAAVGALKGEVLKRAQLDTYVAAKSVNDLRDPLEWLTLGELMDIVRSAKFGGLNVEAAVWRKLQEQLIPVRNRLAHVRILKSGDEETVTMWVKIVDRLFD